MSQIFHRSANTIARVSIFGAVFFIAGLLGLFDAINRSPWVTDARVPREQPIQFSHEPLCDRSATPIKGAGEKASRQSANRHFLGSRLSSA